MPEAPGPLARIVFSVGLLVPLGLALIGILYLLTLTVGQAFKSKSH